MAYAGGIIEGSDQQATDHFPQDRPRHIRRDLALRGVHGALQRGIIAYEYMNEVALPGIPVVMQRTMMAPLAALGHLLGYRPSHSRYGNADESL